MSPALQEARVPAFKQKDLHESRNANVVSFGHDDGKVSSRSSDDGKVSGSDENRTSSDDGKSSDSESDDAKPNKKLKPTPSVGSSENERVHGTKMPLYRDFSQVHQERQEDSTPVPTKDYTFPGKLHQILSDPRWGDIIAWLPHGRSWRVLQPKNFEQNVIPLYFRHGRYSSFARQVNGWGFHRITHGSDYNSYYHELFLHGMPHLCDRMRRLTTKDVAKRKTEGEVPAPNLYAISRKHSLPKSTVPVKIKAGDIALTSSVALTTAFRHSAPTSNADAENISVEKQRAEVTDRIYRLLTAPDSSRVITALVAQVPPVTQPTQVASGIPDLAFLQQHVSRDDAQSKPHIVPAPLFLANGLFQQQQQPNIASILAALSGSAPPPPPPPPLVFQGVISLLMQAGMAALLQQGGPSPLGQANVEGLLSQLLQSVNAGCSYQPASAPVPVVTNTFTQGLDRSPMLVPSAHVPSAGASAPLSGLNVQHVAPLSNANIAQLLIGGTAGSNSDIQRLLLEGNLGSIDLASLLRK